MSTRDISKHILEARGAIGFDQKFRCGLINSQLLFWLRACKAFVWIGFFDFSENQCVAICEDEIYFTDQAAPTMGQYFMGAGRIIGNNRVLGRETRQVICFSFKCLFLHSLNLPFALL